MDLAITATYSVQETTSNQDMTITVDVQTSIKMKAQLVIDKNSNNWSKSIEVEKKRKYAILANELVMMYKSKTKIIAYGMEL